MLDLLWGWLVVRLYGGGRLLLLVQLQRNVWGIVFHVEVLDRGPALHARLQQGPLARRTALCFQEVTASLA